MVDKSIAGLAGLQNRIFGTGFVGIEDRAFGESVFDRIGERGRMLGRARN
jgi:hypothetical protein